MTADADDWNDFDWIGRDDEVVIRPQHETAVFVNQEGSVVIRQRWPDYDDQAVIVTGPNLPALIARLQAAAGEVAEFERWESEHADEAMEDRRDRGRRLRAEIDAERPERAKAIALPSPPAPRSPPSLFDDPSWLKPIAAFLEGRHRVTVTEVIEGALHLDPASTATQRRVADMMLDLGWQRGQRTKDDRWWIIGRDAAHSVTDNSVINDASVTAACRVASPVKRS